jgi:hypothetical protein
MASTAWTAQGPIRFATSHQDPRDTTSADIEGPFNSFTLSGKRRSANLSFQNRFFNHLNNQSEGVKICVYDVCTRQDAWTPNTQEHTPCNHYPQH